MNPETKWSDKENLLIFGTGALLGTIVPGACRVSIDTKNAFNNGKGSSNFGGDFGPELKFAGFDHIIITGKAEKPVYLWVSDGEAEIRDASHLWGKLTHETEHFLKKRLKDDDIKVASIGPAGENLVRGSAIITNFGKVAGGSGVGCIMGDKKLKAIATRGHGVVKVAYPEKFIEVAYEAFKKIKRSPTTKNIRKRTLAGTSYTDSKECDEEWNLGHTIKNSQDIYWPRERRRNIMGLETGVPKFFKKIFACYNCPLGGVPYSEINEGKYKGISGLGYWINSVQWSGKMDVDDPEASLRYHLRANQLGLDGDNSSVVMGWAFECYEKGLLTKEETDGLDLEWGNADDMLQLQEKLAYREGLGDFLAEGVGEAAKKLGKDSEKFAVHQKGQETLDPYRVAKGWSLACATSPVAGRHLRGSVSLSSGSGPKDAIISPYEYDNQPDLVFWQLRTKEIEDMLGICVYTGTWFGARALWPSDYAELTKYALGIEISEEELMFRGRCSYNLEKAFNTIHVGFDRKDDLPHRRFFEDPILSGPHKGETLHREKFNKMLDKFYELHGWDNETSWQTRATLEQLGMHDVAEKLAKVRRLIE